MVLVDDSGRESRCLKKSREVYEAPGATLIHIT